MRRYTEIADVLSRRIAHGDYVIGGLPAEERLAAEMGASRMTARKALEHLAAKGIISRDPSGRRRVSRHPDPARDRLQVAFLTPAYVSPFYQRIRVALEQVLAEYKGVLRPFEYVHVDDAVVYDVLDAFDAIFFFPQPQPMPPRMIERLTDARHRVIAFGPALAGAGVMSIDLFPPIFVHRLLDVLGARGCRRVACLNTQPVARSVTMRVEQWRLWCATHGIAGTLIDEPVEPFHDTTPRAKEVIGRLVDEGRFDADGLFCVTEAAALGATRALYERGIQIGRDLALCTIGDLGFVRDYCPSMTALEMPDPKPYLRVCLDWMQGRSEGWTSSRLICPPEPSIFVGESTLHFGGAGDHRGAAVSRQESISESESVSAR